MKYRGRHQARRKQKLRHRRGKLKILHQRIEINIQAD